MTSFTIPGSSGMALSTPKLVAAVHIDIVEYSRLIAADHSFTVDLIRRVRRHFIEPLSEMRGGRLVNTAGDAFLLIFDSALGAVEFAVALQRGLRLEELVVPAGRDLKLRIGVELGDAICDEADPHGIGVIIAARLQAACPAGGVCISRTIYDQVVSRIDVPFSTMGALALKNVDRPVDALCYDPAGRLGRLTTPQVLKQTEQAPSSLLAEPERQATKLVLPDAPRPRNAVAVLPFSRCEDDATPGYFVDGMVDDIIGELSYFRNLFVVARGSSFSFGRQNLDVRHIGQELGVDFLVEGSVRRRGGGVLIRVHLIYAEERQQIWSDKVEAGIDELFTLQDEICRRIASAIEPQIEAFRRQQARRKPLETIDAHDYYLQAIPYYIILNVEQSRRALEILEQARRLDQHYAPVSARIAACHLRFHDQNWTDDKEGARQKSLKFATEAMSLDGDDATVLASVGHSIASLSDKMFGIQLLNRAIDLNPNHAEAWLRSAAVRIYVGDADIALEHAKRALALSPRDPLAFVALAAKGYAHLIKNDFVAAATCARNVLRIGGNPEIAYTMLATALYSLGEEQQARHAAMQLLTQLPSFGIERWRSARRFASGEPFTSIEKALTDLGFPK